jgi:hypothetical protein
MYSLNRPYKSITAHELILGRDAMGNELRTSRQIDKISELLAFVAVYDRENLIALNTWFEEIREAAERSWSPQMKVMARAAGIISEELILQDETQTGFDERPQSLQVKEMQAFIQTRLSEILSESFCPSAQPVCAHH